jgi:glutamate--cysteine ligase
VDFVLDVPLLFTEVEGRLLPTPGNTFSDWMQRGLDARFPTLHDWDVHLSTVFTEVRMKRFIEVRGADACPTPLALAVPAIWKGLLYDSDALSAAAELASQFPPREIEVIALDAARLGLRAEYRGKSLAAWCRELVALANSGLVRQSRGGHDESVFLEPLREVIASGRSPGDLWPTTGSARGVLAACEYP